MKYKFKAIKHGNISYGATTIFVSDHIADIEDVTPEAEAALIANGGQVVPEKPKKRKSKPVKWQDKDGE